MAQTNWFCFILFSVLFTSQQIVAAIDLARLYGHEGHEVQKRSGNYSIHFRTNTFNGKSLQRIFVLKTMKLLHQFAFRADFDMKKKNYVEAFQSWNFENAQSFKFMNI